MVRTAYCSDAVHWCKDARTLTCRAWSSCLGPGAARTGDAALGGAAAAVAAAAALASKEVLQVGCDRAQVDGWAEGQKGDSWREHSSHKL